MSLNDNNLTGTDILCLVVLIPVVLGGGYLLLLGLRAAYRFITS